jgi:spoIIIJ-associated protein
MSDEDDIEVDLDDAQLEEIPEEPAERVRAIVDLVLDEIDLDAEVEVTESDDEILASIDGTDELGILIGRRGQTLDALQLLCYRAASLGVTDRKRVTVDAAGYRGRRREMLEEEAEIAAGRAKRNGEAVKLEPMSASERRMVHEVLKGRSDVETYSEGDEPERRIVVAPLIDD